MSGTSSVLRDFMFVGISIVVVQGWGYTTESPSYFSGLDDLFEDAILVAEGAYAYESRVECYGPSHYQLSADTHSHLWCRTGNRSSGNRGGWASRVDSIGCGIDTAAFGICYSNTANEGR